MRRLKIIVLVVLITSSQSFGQNPIYNCNVKLLYNCDTIRALMQGKGPVLKINYKKMLKRDKKVITFLNAYHSDTLSMDGLNAILNKVNHYHFSSYRKGDTVNYAGMVNERGLASIYLRYSYIEGTDRLISRFYNLEINNREKGYDQPFDYHYKIFGLLNFCLGRRFGCYNFDEGL